MKTAQADLTTGPLGKKIFRFSIPLIFSNLLQVLFNMADVAVVGRFAGSTALGAVGSTTIFVSLFTGFLIGLSAALTYWWRTTSELTIKRTSRIPSTRRR